VGGGRRGGGRGGRMGHATRNERRSRFTRATERMASCFVMYHGRLQWMDRKHTAWAFVQYLYWGTDYLLILFRFFVHQICPQGVLETPDNVCSGVEKVSLLEDQHSANLRLHVELAFHVP